MLRSQDGTAFSLAKAARGQDLTTERCLSRSSKTAVSGCLHGTCLNAARKNPGGAIILKRNLLAERPESATDSLQTSANKLPGRSCYFACCCRDRPQEKHSAIRQSSGEAFSLNGQQLAAGLFQDLTTFERCYLSTRMYKSPWNIFSQA